MPGAITAMKVEPSLTPQQTKAESVWFERGGTFLSGWDFSPVGFSKALVLLALLGLGGMRTLEKFKGVHAQ